MEEEHDPLITSDGDNENKPRISVTWSEPETARLLELLMEDDVLKDFSENRTKQVCYTLKI